MQLTDEQIKNAQDTIAWLQNSLSQASIDVIEERRRQQEKEGWTPEHDDQHSKGELATAAACYAGFSDAYPNCGQPPFFWPFEGAWWKPSNYRRDLVKAAALILAEIERIDRAEAAKS